LVAFLLFFEAFFQASPSNSSQPIFSMAAFCSGRELVFQGFLQPFQWHVRR
jgi:hypothetical protein